MSFRFDFGEEDASGPVEEPSVPAIETGTGVAQAEEYLPPESGTLDVQYEVVMINNFPLRKRTFGDIKVSIAERDNMEAANDNNPLIQSIVYHTDLIRGAYEGGFKTWEGSFDLLTLLATETMNWSAQLQGKAVLEIGCGSALPGILALQLGASRVDFQDYNREVLELSTFPNVILNNQETSSRIPNPEAAYDDISLSWNSISQSSRFFSGDWSSLSSKFSVEEHLKQEYDFIFTSDTIYESSNLKSLLDFIHVALKPGGKAYIAAKSNYFGCTGSLATFLQFVSIHSPTASIRSVFRHEDTVCREILEYTVSFQ